MLGLSESYAVTDPVNVGSSEEICMLDLVTTLMNLSSVSKPIRLDRTKPEGALRKASDTQKLLRVLPEYRPEFSVIDGLREMVEAYQARMKPQPIAEKSTI